MSINSINPANGQVIQSYQTHTPKELSKIIAGTHQAWEKWKETPFSLRGKLLLAVAKILRSRKEELAVLMALKWVNHYKVEGQKLKNAQMFVNTMLKTQNNS
jgi:succinate-semialdehyde dehydrogenase/glutarate-semialdehyde dehydrogenase